MNSKNRPGVLAVRAVNQYRRRDVLTYLGLRYYLDNIASRTDGWARSIAVDLVSTRTEPIYFHAHHFKDVIVDNKIKHRAFHIPGANEAVAETALLAECSKYKVFKNPACVYSYELTAGDDRGGVYVPYFEGLTKRQRHIAEAAKQFPEGVVQYVDIKRFYPSITESKAKQAWSHYATKAPLRTRWIGLGNKLISDQVSVGRKDEVGLLTGPMLSHLLANIVLREFDENMSKLDNIQYFRYVDDITIVGQPENVDFALDLARTMLGELGFALHGEDSEKTLRVTSKVWLMGEHDWELSSSQGVSWPRLIGDIKRYLMLHNGDHQLIREMLYSEGFRLPVPDYRVAISEAKWLNRFVALARYTWFKVKVRSVSIDQLLVDARSLREQVAHKFDMLSSELKSAKGFERKRLVPKLRHVAGQLIYLAEVRQLSEKAGVALTIPELHLFGRVMEAVGTRNIDNLISLGTNAVQAAAQALSVTSEIVSVTLKNFSEAEIQGLAILIMNGVNLSCSREEVEEGNELLRLAYRGCDKKLMKSDNKFYRELSCLHGIAADARHSSMLNTAFDLDDDLVADAIGQLAGPSP